MNVTRPQTMAAAAPAQTAERGNAWWPAVAVLVAVLAVFLPVLRNGFINLDDGVYVTTNPQVSAGLTLEGIRWAFHTFASGNWHPVTWLSLMLDAQLFGTQAWSFHLTSVVLHALNASLVFVLLRTLTGSRWRSLLVAVFFGVHPLRVESVAWVAERKDVLSTLFGLLALLAYVAWRRPGGKGLRPARWFGVLSFSCLALGLMSKPMLVTLPCVMLLLDFWPLRRIDGSLAGAWALVREKIPFFGLAVVGAASTWIAQASVGAIGSVAAYPVGARLANAVASYVAYLGKTFWPADLAIIYPFARTHAPEAMLGGGLVLVAITAGAFLLRRSRPYLLVGWLWFGGTLVPVIGLVQVGGQGMADRYTYLPSIGLLVALVWLGAEVVGLGRWWRRAGVGVAVVAALALSGATVRQIALWKDSETAFRHALEVTHDNHFAHHCLALALAEDPGRREEALEELRAAVRIVPELPDAHLQLAVALSGAGPAALPESIAEYRATVRLNPGDADAHYGLARVLLRTEAGFSEAIAELRRTLALAPGHVDARSDLADCLAVLPEGASEAEAAYSAVLQLRPERVELRNNLGLLLARVGRLPEAIAEYEEVLRAKPEFAQARNNLANALRGLPDRRADSIAQYRAALALNPEYWEAHFNLGLLLAEEPEDEAEAIAHFRAVRRLRPDYEPARGLLGQLGAE